MKSDPQSGPLVSYSFGPAPQDRGVSAPATEAPAEEAIDPNRPTWAQWCEARDQYPVSNGWSFCRFGVRGDSGGTALFYGLVSGPFGVHGQPMMACNGKIRWPERLAILSHLPTGAPMACFIDVPSAIMGAEIARRMSALEWLSDQGGDPLIDKIMQARCFWRAAGMFQIVGTHAHTLTDDDTEISIWGAPIVGGVNNVKGRKL